MLWSYQHDIRESVRASLHRAFELEFDEKRIVIEYPPESRLGDLALPLPFHLAKILRKPPGMIAQELVEATGWPESVKRAEATPSGYLNLFLDRQKLLRELLEVKGFGKLWSKEKVIIEHTNINPNKAAHIGHLRNAVLGDTLACALRALGAQVEVHNYIDDTGVQVADVLVGFQQLRQMSADDIRTISEPIDDYCWDLYAEVQRFYEEDEDRLSLRAEALRELEAGRGALAELAMLLTPEIVQRHLETMARIGVSYDLLPREADIIALDLWGEAFRLLQDRGAIFQPKSGSARDCWVMDLEKSEAFQEMDQPNKILVRSDGTVTYVGKDIAYQLWKFGLTERNFGFRPFHSYPDGKAVWTTTSQHEEIDREAPPMGHGERVINVIDVRQSYLQQIVQESLRVLGYEEQAAHSIHFGYEMVVLTHRCAAQMGIELSEAEASRPYVEVSGRRGHGVRANELLDALEKNAEVEVGKRNPDLKAEMRASLAHEIAVGALRYFLLKYANTKVIAFDFEDVLNFEGETGPYIQYAVVRADRIREKAEERGVRFPPFASLDLMPLDQENELWGFLVSIARLDEVLHQAAESLELSRLAKHTHYLAKIFNQLYHRYPVLQEEDEPIRGIRMAVFEVFRQRMRDVLGIMGINIPPMM